MCLTDCKGVTKMSKRFNIAYGGNVITDKDGRDLNLSVKWCVEELVGLLNEQQATIKQLENNRSKCNSCVHKPYPIGRRYEYFEDNDIYVRDNLTGERFYQSDLDMLCNLLNNYDKDWQSRRVERALEIQNECRKIKNISIEKWEDG